jgi:hypothetical protein
MKRPFLSRLFSSSSPRDEADSPKNDGAARDDPPESAHDGEQEFVMRVVQRTYSGLQMFVRDANLPQALAEKYEAGRIIREPSVVDASRRIGGMSATHRFAILSNHMKSLEAFDFGNRGWCVVNMGSCFKVMGTHSARGKTFILLLHLPEEGDAWQVFQHIRVNLEDTMKAASIERLEERLDEAVIPELDDEEWRDRCAHPVGMDDQGEFFPLEA